MLIAIEGIDGAGKRTQASLLKERLERGGWTAGVIAFPRYGRTVFARSVAEYLNGGFGPLHTVDPHLAALLYAGDRFESRDVLAALAAAHDVVILDRYVASNLAYQGARVAPAQRQQFVEWIARIEHEVYGLPKAGLTLFLDLPVEVAAGLVLTKGGREYTTRAADIHEQDLAYLSECRRVYQSLAEADHDGAWRTITCLSDAGTLLDPAAIHEAVWRAVSAVAPRTGQAAAPPAQAG